MVRGRLSDAIADRLHWAPVQPALAKRVPELRELAFYRRWFFHRKTARFDAALCSVVLAAVMRRPMVLLATLPYAIWIAREAARFRGSEAVAHAAGSVVVDGATLVGLLWGSIRARSLLL